MPITQNDLAGSKKLYNFFDSVFAIGKSAKDENLRYIKQLKVRYGNFEYGGNNVIVCAIEKADDFLRFVTLGHAAESALFSCLLGVCASIRIESPYLRFSSISLDISLPASSPFSEVMQR